MAQAEGARGTAILGERRKTVMSGEEMCLSLALFPQSTLGIKYSFQKFHALTHLILLTSIHADVVVISILPKNEVQKGKLAEVL